jgi:hypothetical protein
MKRTLAAAGGLVCLFSVSSAWADITFCNHYSSEVWVTWADYSTTACSCNEAEVIGWFNIQPGQCNTVFYGCGYANGIDFYAIASDNAYWAGADNMGSLSYNAFDTCAQQNTVCCNPPCPINFNYPSVGFRYVSFGDGTNCNCFFECTGWQGTINLN